MAINKRSGTGSSAQDNFIGPDSVTGVTASDVGTNRAYNDGAITVSWTAPAAGNTPTGYKVYESSTLITTVSYGTNTATVTGLATGSSHTYSVSAYDSYGETGKVSASAVTVTTVPAQPGAPTASAGVDQDTVSWSAPANGGKAITNYYWTCSDGKSGNTTSTSITVSQEANTAQTYNVRADNANGSSATSANSNSVTTLAPSFFSPPFFPPSFFSPPFFPPFFPPSFFVPPYFSGCIDQDTLVRVVGQNNSIEYKEAKYIKAGDQVWSAGWDELIDESIAFPSEPINQITNATVTANTVADVIRSIKATTMTFNNDATKRFSLQQSMLVWTGSQYIFKNSGVIEVGESLVDVSENGSLSHVLVESIQLIDEERVVYQFNVEPVDTLIAANLVIHNPKLF